MDLPFTVSSQRVLKQVGQLGVPVRNVLFLEQRKPHATIVSRIVAQFAKSNLVSVTGMSRVMFYSDRVLRYLTFGEVFSGTGISEKHREMGHMHAA